MASLDDSLRAAMITPRITIGYGPSLLARAPKTAIDPPSQQPSTRCTITITTTIIMIDDHLVPSIHSVTSTHDVDSSSTTAGEVTAPRLRRLMAAENSFVFAASYR